MKRAMRYGIVGMAAMASVAVARPPAASPADAQMAEDYATKAMETLSGKEIGTSVWAESEALAMAAHKLDPADRRWPALVARLAESAGDTDAIVQADKNLLSLQPDHRGAQRQLIDIFLSRMETADAKDHYLRTVLSNKSIANDVRSYAAVCLSRVLLERSEKTQAQSMLAQAIALNPLNADAWQMHYQLIEPTATVLEKANDLLGLLRANPAQPNTAWSLGRLLSQVGLEKESLAWYGVAVSGMPRTGEPLPEDVLVDFASAMYLSGDPRGAEDLIGKALSANDSASQLWLLKAAIQKQQKDPGLHETIAQANVACFNILQTLRQNAGDKQATTRPVDLGEPVTLPNMSQDLQRISADKTGKLRGLYVSAVGNWAWLEIYFARKPQDAQNMLAFLNQILPTADPVLNRLQGWNEMVQGNDDAARAKFTASAQADPLAAMGILLLDQKHDADKVAPEARKLLSENSVGIVGAMLYSGLKGTGVDLIPSKQSQAVADVLQKFPNQLMNILDQPQAFYAIHIQPTQIAYGYDEPMLVRVAIQNLTNVDLSVGNNGVIKPGVLLDAQQRGIGDEFFGGCAFVRMDQAMVLRGGDEISQIVRVDRGAFGKLLQNNPGATLQFALFGTTNPLMTKDHMYVGLAGYHVQMPSIIERDGLSMQSDNWQQKLNQMLGSDNGADRIRAIHLITEYAKRLRTGDNADADSRKHAGDLMAAVANAASDPSPSVQATAAYAQAAAAPEEQRWPLLEQMATDANWQKQLLAAYGLQNAPVAIQKKVDTKLASDGADPIVKRYASARLATIAHPTTQP